MKEKMDERWHEQDEFWERHTQVMFSEERMERTPNQVDALIALLDVQPDNTILDLCCGVGRHTLELARRGFKVDGVDRTKHYLNIARKQAKAEGLDINLIEADMREFRRENSFDVILSMFTSFGYFEDQEDQHRVLENIHASLKSGGKVLFDLLSKEKLARVFRERDWHRTEAGFKLEERKVSKDWSWVDSTWILISKEGKVSEWSVSHWIYSAAEMKMMLKSVGLDILGVYGSLEGDPYDHEANRLVVIGRKG
ncbi:MAG: class I SAM-dependent methyltransferase [Candidatus Thorarchaeota archaeon]